MRLALGGAALVIVGVVALLLLRGPTSKIESPAPAAGRPAERPAQGRAATTPTRPPLGQIPAVPPPRSDEEKLPLPRSLADVKMTPEVKAGLARVKADDYEGSPRFEGIMNTQLEALARLNECLGDEIKSGYVHADVWFKDGPPKSGYVISEAAVLEKAIVPDLDDIPLLKQCIETGLVGIMRKDPDGTRGREYLFRLNTHLPPRANSIYEFLRTGQEPAKKPMPDGVLYDRAKPHGSAAIPPQ